MQEVAIGAVGTLFCAWVVWMFKARQLYLVIPRMFSHGGLTGSGKLIELRLYNRGNFMEEELQLSLPPQGSYELVGAEHPDLLLENNKISLARLAPKTETSILILAEGIAIDEFLPSLSSKAASAKTFKKIEEVPPNYGIMALTICGILLFLASLYSGVEYAKKSYEEDLIELKKELKIKQKEEEEKRKEMKVEAQRLIDEKTNAQAAYRKKYSYLDDLGWQGIDRYVKSDVHLAYAGNDFPISFSSAKLLNGRYLVTFVVTNKTSSHLTLTSYFNADDIDEDVELYYDEGVFDMIVQPSESKTFTVSTKNNKNQIKEMHIVFSLKFSSETIWGLKFVPIQNKTAKKIEGVQNSVSAVTV